jgi:hypothetical protein
MELGNFIVYCSVEWFESLDVTPAAFLLLEIAFSSSVVDMGQLTVYASSIVSSVTTFLAHSTGLVNCLILKLNVFASTGIGSSCSAEPTSTLAFPGFLSKLTLARTLGNS